MLISFQPDRLYWVSLITQRSSGCYVSLLLFMVSENKGLLGSAHLLSNSYVIVSYMVSTAEKYSPPLIIVVYTTILMLLKNDDNDDDAEENSYLSQCHLVQSE